MKQEIETLNNAAHKLAEMMYKEAASQQAGAQSGAGAGPAEGGEAGAQPERDSGKKDKDDVVDAEFEVVDDDKDK